MESLSGKVYSLGKESPSVSGLEQALPSLPVEPSL
jgi:hypothetical protein